MADQAVGLSCQLLKKLDNTEDALTNRLGIAQLVFTSPSIPIPRKEELVLQWICGTLETYGAGQGEDDLQEIYEVLANCLGSKRWMKTFAGHIRLTTTEALFKNLNGVLSISGVGVKKKMQECIIALIESLFYQRWFTQDVNSLIGLINSCLSSVGAPTSDEELMQLLCRTEHALLSISKQCLLKAELRSAFLREGLVPLGRALAELKVDDGSQPLMLFNRCVSQIILFDKKFALELAKGFQTKSEVTPPIKEFLWVFKKLPTHSNDRTVTLCFTAYLRAVFDRFKDDSNTTFHTFNYLCSLLGISVHKVKSVSKKPIKNWSNEQSFRVMASLVRFLDTNGFPFTCDLNEVSLQDWFTCVITGMVCINVNDLSLELLDLVHAIFVYNPLILENSVRSIAVIMLQKKEGATLDKYTEVMKKVWEGAGKTGRFQKIIARFLPLLSEIMKFSCDDSIRIGDIIPTGVADSFSDSVTSLPSSQVVSLMKSIMFHMETDCLAKLDNQDLPLDSEIILPMEVISELLTQFLRGVKIADNSVSNTVQDKFGNMKSELEELLGNICSAIILRSHNDRLLVCLFKMCFMLGRLELKLQYFYWARHKDLELIDSEPTNLSYLHPYIPPTHWLLLAHRVENHNCADTRDIFKMEAVSQVEVGDDSPGTLAGRYLLERAPPDWFWDHVPTLACHLEAKELINLSRLLVQATKYKVDLWIPIVKADPFLKNRRWALATVLTFLVKIAQRVDKNKKGGALSKRVMCGFGAETWELAVLKYDTESEFYGASTEVDGDAPSSQHNEDCVDGGGGASRTGVDTSSSESKLVNFLQQASNAVQEAVSDTYTPFSENLSLTRDLHLLNLIPVHQFGTKSQTLIMLTLVMFLVDLPQDEENDEYIFNIMLSMLEGQIRSYSTFFNNVDSDQLLRFFAARAKGYKHYHRFLEKFIYITLLAETPAKQVIKNFKSPNKDNVWITSIIIRTIIQMKKKKMDLGDGKGKVQVIEKLVNKCLTVVSNEPPSPQLLAPYSTIIRHLVVHSNSNLKLLTPKLQLYKEIAIKNYKEDTYLLETLLQHHSELGIKKGDHLLVNAWTSMINSEDSWPTPLMNYAFHFATGNELESMLRLLFDKTVEILTADESLLQAVEKCFSLWGSVVTVGSQEKQSQVKQAVSWIANAPLLRLASAWEDWLKVEYVPPILDFITTLAQTPSVELLPGVLDTCLLLLSSVPYPIDNTQRLVEHLNCTIDCLFAFYHFRKSLVLDRLPALLQRYRVCMTTLAQCATSDSQLTEEESSLLEAAQICAYKLEKGTAAMTKRQRDFVRIAPHLVADILQIMEKYPMLHSIKCYYVECINTLLSLCDVHSIQFLNSPALPPPSQELFKVIYEDYKKFHKYTGKA